MAENQHVSADAGNAGRSGVDDRASAEVSRVADLAVGEVDAIST